MSDRPNTGTGTSIACSLVVPAHAIVGEFLQTFIDFPPRMKAASFTIDQMQEKLEAAISAGR